MNGGNEGKRIFTRPMPGQPSIEEKEEISGGGTSKHEMEVQPHVTKDVVARTDKRTKRRGRRQRKEVAWEIVMVPPSGLRQLMDVVRKAAMRKGSAVAIINQEHHRDKTQLADMQAMLRKAHWRMAAAPAVEGARGGQLGKGRNARANARGMRKYFAESRHLLSWLRREVSHGLGTTSRSTRRCDHIRLFAHLRGPQPEERKVVIEGAANCKGQRIAVDHRSWLPR